MLNLVDIIILKVYYTRINVNNVPQPLLIPKSDTIRLLLAVCDAYKEDKGSSYDDCFMEFSERNHCFIYYVNWKEGSDLYCIEPKHELSLRACFCEERSMTLYDEYDDLLKKMGQRTINKLVNSVSYGYNNGEGIKGVNIKNYKLLYKYILNSEVVLIYE